LPEQERPSIPGSAADFGPFKPIDHINQLTEIGHARRLLTRVSVPPG